MIIVIALLSVMLVFQQIFYLREIQKLINKLMSRNYGEYMQSKQPEEQPKIKIDEGIPDNDIAVMNEYMR